MKKASIVFAFLAMIAFMAAYPGLAQKASEQKPMHKGMMGCKQLNLSPEQQEKMQKLCLDFQKEMLTLRTAVQTKMLDLKKLVLEKADTNAINGAIDAIAKARAEIQKKAFAHHQEIGKLLTDEQKKIFDQMGCGMEMKGKVCGQGCSHGENAHGCSHRCGKGEKKHCVKEQTNCKDRCC
jgi:Spy/CpxP family protein refolding chaperone